jgi:hypothetical protein
MRINDRQSGAHRQGSLDGIAAFTQHPQSGGAGEMMRTCDHAPTGARGMQHCEWILPKQRMVSEEKRRRPSISFCFICAHVLGKDSFLRIRFKIIPLLQCGNCAQIYELKDWLDLTSRVVRRIRQVFDLAGWVGRWRVR